MYAQAVGSLPIAYKTGGLADTIDDNRSGFLFSALNERGLTHAVARALGAFRSKPRISRMRKNALSKRFDWGASARRYLGVYSASQSG
jgi:starch synthase